MLFIDIYKGITFGNSDVHQNLYTHEV